MELRPLIRSIIKENLNPPQRRSIRVHYEDGNVVPTEINGTEEEINDYYVGKYFNFGVEDDKMVKAVRVEFLDGDGTQEYVEPYAI
jgi:hypothetical protein